nr:MAG TPA: hypothetical protein [Caudoviricetes sp.]
MRPRRHCGNSQIHLNSLIYHFICYALKKYNFLPLVFPISMCNQEISPLLSHFSTRIGYLSLS